MYILNYLIKFSQSWMFAFNNALINALMLIDQIYVIYKKKIIQTVLLIDCD